MKNPSTTWRPTKKIVSASQSDTYALLRRAPLQHGGLASGQPAVISSHMPPPPLVPTHSTPPQVCHHPCLTLRPENKAWKPGPGAAFKNQSLRASLIDVCQIIQAKKKWERCSPTPPRSLKKHCPLPLHSPKHFPAAAI